MFLDDEFEGPFDEETFELAQKVFEKLMMGRFVVGGKKHTRPIIAAIHLGIICDEAREYWFNKFKVEELEASQPKKRWFLASAGLNDTPDFSSVTELKLDITPDEDIKNFYGNRLFTAEEGDERLLNLKKV